MEYSEFIAHDMKMTRQRRTIEKIAVDSTVPESRENTDLAELLFGNSPIDTLYSFFLPDMEKQKHRLFLLRLAVIDRDEESALSALQNIPALQKASPHNYLAHIFLSALYQRMTRVVEAFIAKGFPKKLHYSIIGGKSKKTFLPSFFFAMAIFLPDSVLAKIAEEHGSLKLLQTWGGLNIFHLLSLHAKPKTIRVLFHLKNGVLDFVSNIQIQRLASLKLRMLSAPKDEFHILSPHELDDIAQHVRAKKRALLGGARRDAEERITKEYSMFRSRKILFVRRNGALAIQLDRDNTEVYPVYPLDFACFYNNTDCVSRLAKIAPECVALSQFCLLVQQHLDLTFFLLKYKPNLTVRNSLNETILHVYAKHCCAELVGVALDAGIGINEKDMFMNTPIHLAALCGNKEIVQYMEKHGALDRKNVFGLSAKQILERTGALPHTFNLQNVVHAIAMYRRIPAKYMEKRGRFTIMHVNKSKAEKDLGKVIKKLETLNIKKKTLEDRTESSSGEDELANKKFHRHLRSNPSSR